MSEAVWGQYLICELMILPYIFCNGSKKLKYGVFFLKIRQMDEFKFVLVSGVAKTIQHQHVVYAQHEEVWGG